MVADFYLCSNSILIYILMIPYLYSLSFLSPSPIQKTNIYLARGQLLVIVMQGLLSLANDWLLMLLIKLNQKAILHKQKIQMYSNDSQ